MDKTPKLPGSAGTDENSTSPVPSKTPPPQKPDEAAYTEKIKKKREEVEAVRNKLSEISTKISGFGGGREQFFKQRDESRAKIAELNSRIEAIELERKSVRDGIMTSQNQGRTMKSKTENLQKSIGFRTVEEIDREIQRQDYERMTASLSLKEEAKVLDEIERLRLLRPEIDRLAEMQSRVNVLENVDSASTTNQKLNILKDELRKLRDARSDEQAKITDLEAEREQSMAPLKHHLSERDELRQSLGVLSIELSEVQSEWRTKDMEYRAYQARSKNARLEFERFERQKEQLDADKKSLLQEIDALQNKATNKKLVLARQLRAYLEDQMKTQSEGEPGQSSPSDEQSIETRQVAYREDTYVPLVREEVEPITNKKKNRRSMRKQKNIGKDTNKSIQLDMATIRDFTTVGIADYPKSLNDCPTILAKLGVIIEELEGASSVIFEAVERKRSELLAKLDKLTKREEELKSRQPTNVHLPKAPIVKEKV